MELQRADPRFRRFAVLSCVLLVLAGAIALWAFQSWLVGVARAPAAAAQRELLIALACLLGASCAMLLALGVFLWRTGARVRRAVQFPPPAMRVLRDTTVLRGDAAHRRARIIQGTGAALAVCSMALLIAAWRFLALFAGHAL
jgi:hypothetical protein